MAQNLVLQQAVYLIGIVQVNGKTRQATLFSYANLSATGSSRTFRAGLAGKNLKLYVDVSKHFDI